MGKKHTNESIDKLLHDRTISRLECYKGYKVPITFKCDLDGFEWKSRPDVILQAKNGCPFCCNSVRITDQSIDLFIFENKLNVNRIGNYKNDKTKLTFKCTICKHIWDTRWDVVKKCKCPECSRREMQLDISKVNKALIDIEFIPLIESEYKGYYHKTKFICDNNPDHIIETSFSSVRRYTSCPLCKSTGRSEEYVYNKLLSIFNKVERQKKLLFNNRKYFVDFYIPEVNMYIEYNGQQHYKPTRFNGLSEKQANINFKLQKKRDLEVKNYIINILESNFIELHYSLMHNKKNINRVLENLHFIENIEGKK